MAVAPARIRYEVRGYFRQADTIFFTFLFPILMFAIFSSIFPGDVAPVALTSAPGASTESISLATYYLPGLVAAGLLISGIQNLATDVARERYDGTLKRLGGTPMSPVTYMAGKLGQVFATAIVQCALLLLVARFAFGVALPRDPARWATFAWVFVLGLAACAVLGFALSAVPRSARSASAVVMPLVLILQFISGVYVPDFQLPDGVRNLAALFPLSWLARGMRSVFLPDGFAILERGQTWGLASMAAVLAAWLIVGAVLTRLTFRWIRRDA